MASNVDGAIVLKSDPGVEEVGFDTGIELDDGRTLRAPDVSVGPLERAPGWSRTAPPLALEYADRGQDERESQAKIADLLGAGTRWVWLVRLTGLQRVEVYEARRKMRVVGLDEVLTAPGVLKNPVLARSLVDSKAATQATLRNLLNREGYDGLEAVVEFGKAEGKAEGSAAGKVHAALTVLATRGVAISDDLRRRLEACRDEATLDRVIVACVTVARADDLPLPR